MQLIIAEKPSVAQSIAAVLGATERKDGYIQGGGYIVSWCIGHLVGLAAANVYDECYQKWQQQDLPILPQEWQYTVAADKKKQFNILQELMNRKDIESLVCFEKAKYNNLIEKRRWFNGLSDGERGWRELGHYCPYGELLLFCRAHTRCDEKG